MPQQSMHGNPANYNASPATRTDGSPSALEVDNKGNLKTVGGGAADGDTATGNPTIIGGVYNATPPTYTTLDAVTAQFDINGNLKVTQATLLAGEDLANDVLKVEQRFSLLNCTADTLVKTGVGFLHSITFAQTDAAPTAGTIVIYDNTAESGTIIQTVSFTTAVFQPYTLIYDGVFSAGLYIGFTTTNDVNVTVSYR